MKVRKRWPPLSGYCILHLSEHCHTMIMPYQDTWLLISDIVTLDKWSCEIHNVVIQPDVSPVCSAHHTQPKAIAVLWGNYVWFAEGFLNRKKGQACAFCTMTLRTPRPAQSTQWCLIRIWWIKEIVHVLLLFRGSFLPKMWQSNFYQPNLTLNAVRKWCI